MGSRNGRLTGDHGWLRRLAPVRHGNDPRRARRFAEDVSPLPRAQRPATAAELAAISTVARGVVFHGRHCCVTYRAQISTLDPRYAGVQYDLHKPYGTCLVGNGVSVFVRGASGWRHLEDTSEPFFCNSLPPGVVRSLYGGCMTFR